MNTNNANKKTDNECTQYR